MSKNEEIIAKLDDLMNEYRVQKKSALRNTLIFSAVLLIMLFAFTGIIRSNIEDNFSQASIEKSFNEKFATIEPLLPIYADRLISGIPEAYANALSTELQSQLPLIQANFIKETSKLTQSLKKRLENQLNDTLGKDFVKKQIAIISGKSNNVKKTQEASDLIDKQITLLINNVSGNFQKLFQNDVDELINVVKTFPRDKESVLSEKQATKMLMHYLISLVDTELLAMN